MSEPIHLLHFGDVHIGTENYGKTDPETGVNSRVLDFLRRMSEVVEFARRIKRLAGQCPVVLLVGNHDLPSMTQKASSVEIFHTLAVPNVTVGRADQLHVIETKRGPVQVATVPYPMRQRLLAGSERGLRIADLDRALQEEIERIIRDMAEQVDPSIPAVLTGHFSVSGAVWGSERSVMLGHDVIVLKSTLNDPTWDYVALGHIHHHQDLTLGEEGVPPIVYCGSLERIDFGEEDDRKGFCWVELERGQTRYEFIEVDARPFVTIRADVRGYPDPTAAVLDAITRHEVREAVVRALITCTPDDEPHLRDREIEAALSEAAFIAAIQHQIEHPVRARLGSEGPEALPPLELLRRYLGGRNHPPERIELLLEHADALFREASDDSER
jgi:exonuclease SbcD